MITAPPGFRVRPLHRGWFLLLAVALIVIAICIAVLQPYFREQRIIRMINGWGGRVEAVPKCPDRLQQLVGRKWIQEIKVFSRVVGVVIDRGSATDEDLVHLIGLKHLTTLSLGNTQVTDAGLVHLRGRTELKYLWIDHTDVTDAGLADLTALKEIELLCLDNTRVTDAGLKRLSEFKQLKALSLVSTGITDAGIEHLAKLTTVNSLWLDGTQVTDQGREALERARPACNMWHSR
jgi:hypothetical protein